MTGITGVLLLAGCLATPGPDGTGEPGEDSALAEADREIALAKIEALGLDPSTAVFEGNRIGVEGDILLYLDDLLAGAYDGSGEADEDGLVEKGYRASTKVNSTHDGNISLWGTTDTANEPAIVTGALVAAASWSFGSSIDISVNNTGPGIVIRFVQELPCPDAQPSWIACAEWPKNGKPGHSIYLLKDPGPLTGGCTWNDQIATYIIGHEMGHAIGMTHAGEGTHIPGTGHCSQWAPWPASTCTVLGLAPYDTIMHRFAWGLSGCSVADPWLGEDDLASVAALYPE